MLDEPGVSAVHPQQRGRAVPDQLQRVPPAVGQGGVAHRPLHLPHRAGVRHVLDVAVPQLGGGGAETQKQHKRYCRGVKTFQTSDFWGVLGRPVSMLAGEQLTWRRQREGKGLKLYVSR